MRLTDRGRLSRVAGAIACTVLSVSVAQRSAAQIPVLLEGLADAEGWATTSRSNLLTRNEGQPGELLRVQLWGAVEPWRRFVIYGQLESEGGRARNEDDSFEVYNSMYGVRYAASRTFVVDVGKLQPVVGTFAPRHFSNRNPLIGSPDGYSLDYPLGASLTGETRHFDYRAAMVSLPASHEGYVPAPTERLRPAVGAGFTPVVGVRFGASYTEGPYLNDDYTPAQLGNRRWTDYGQRVIAVDLKFARGYLETYAEAAHGSYEVPGRADAITGYTYYGEAKYTFTPRFFVAVRAEQNAYPFIRLIGGNWVSRRTDFVDGEVGAGYRARATTLVKASVRGDRWWVAPGATGFLGRGGLAVALQVSQSFDVLGLFRRAQ